MRREIGVREMRRFLAVLILAACSCDSPTSWTAGLPVAERPARAEELFAYPPDGHDGGVNPPGFTWTPHDDAASYRIEVARMDEGMRLVLNETATSTVHAPASPLDPGDYRWQVVYLAEDRQPLGVSETRTFTLSAEAALLPMPDVRGIERELQGVRPRLFLNEENLRSIRRAVSAGEVDWWPYFLAAADAAVEQELFPEPEGYPNGEWSVDEWRRIYRPAKVGSTHLARAALAYRITGEAKYLEAARRWMMNFASWDPRGIISHDVPQPDGSVGNDEGSMPLLERMAFAWDWVGPELTAEERERVLAVMPERGNQVLRLLHEQDFHTHPFENHEGRVLAFLGNAGLSFLGDIPEARDWLEYVIRCYLTSFPGWGSDAGGWAQGLGYWSGYVGFLSTFAESLRGATDVDILRRPFYRNTGYLSLYFHPPYAPRGAFGDDSGGPPSHAERVLVDFFAETWQDPYLKWQAVTRAQAPPDSPFLVDGGERWNEWAMEDVLSVLRAGSKRTGPQPPAGLEGSRFWPDIGWVAMHSRLGDAEKDVWALFKSSRYGSFSHSHGDQNTFQLNAYGEALAIDSGYYPYYGSPHHSLWTRQTRAHNGVLVNGRGQAPFSWEASGSIEHYEHSGAITLARGQAAAAYAVKPRASVIKQWKEHLEEPLPPMEPRLESFERSVVFVNSDTPLFLVYDHLRTESPARFEWLLHSLERIAVRNGGVDFVLRGGKARAAVRLLASAPFQVSQTDRFRPPPGNRYEGAPGQWHLTARTERGQAEAKFLAVFVPYRDGEAAPAVETLRGENTVGFRVRNVEVAAWWGGGERGPLDGAGADGKGRLAVSITDQQAPQSFLSE